ncbi:MAG: tetratricopeptide repeat protein [Alphaproteobacteria bacterium]|nr:tetratricopeptide repeat protein [Alphaproteobacteria bacterium]MCB9699393.1 tetratricopeptide repeat protein [Alphaproteobacteria bacterium]
MPRQDHHQRPDALRTWGPVVLVLVALPLLSMLLRTVLPAIGPKAHAPDPVPSPAPPPPAAGSATCASCHAEQAEAWRASTHARAEHAGDDGAPTSLDAIGPDGASRAYPIERWIGVTPLQQGLVAFPGGRLQVTQAARDPRDGSWFDVFGDGREPGEWGHWTGGGMTWNARCGECHTTAFDKGWDETTATYASTFEEADVGCEACHGDGDAHAAGAPAAVVDAGGETCFPCHARRSDLTGAWRPGDAFLDHFAPSLVDRGDTFWPDGQVRDEDFEVTAFLGSRMHAQGVTCTSCHDPHSGRTRAEGDALCLSCHAAMPGFTDHDPHPEGVEPGCVGCHMPVTVYMQRDPRHDHGFLRPDPVMQQRHGIPSACDRCHADRGVAWQVEAARRWWGPDGPPHRARADLIARGRAGDETAVEGLMALLRDDPVPAWRAAAAAQLEPWLLREDVRTALLTALKDEDPLVRFAAVGAVAPAAPEPATHEALTAARADTVRAVRIQAVRALRAELRPNDPRTAEYRTYLARHADETPGLFERGTWALERGDAGAAIPDLARARDLDPRAPATRDALAIALATAGHPTEAAEELREATRLAPDQADLWVRSGLAEVAAGHGEQAVAALQHAVDLDPSHSRAWYNLGLLRQQLGDAKGALDALRQAVEVAPDDTEVRFALAAVLRDQGRLADARAEAERILQIDPQDGSARALLASLVP